MCVCVCVCLRICMDVTAYRPDHSLLLPRTWMPARSCACVSALRMPRVYMTLPIVCMQKIPCFLEKLCAALAYATLSPPSSTPSLYDVLIFGVVRNTVSRPLL